MSSPSSNPRPTFFTMEILSVGINYTSVEIPGFPRLKWAAKDARTMAALMAANGYRATELVDDESATPEQKPTQAGIRAALQQILRRRPSRLIVFVAAHGITRLHAHGRLVAAPEFSLVTSPEKVGDPRAEIRLSELVSMIQETRAYDATDGSEPVPGVQLPPPAVLFIVDACRNLEDSKGGSGKTARSQGTPVNPRDIVGAIRQPFCDLPNFEVIFATPEGDTTHESDDLEHGCATYALLRAFQDHPQGLNARQWAFHANAHYLRSGDARAGQGSPIRHSFEGALTFDSFAVIYPQHLLGRLAHEYRATREPLESTTHPGVDGASRCPECDSNRHRVVSLQGEVETLKGQLEFLRSGLQKLSEIRVEPTQPTWPAWLPQPSRWIRISQPGRSLLWIDLAVGEILPALVPVRTRSTARRTEIAQGMQDLADLEARLARTPVPEGLPAGYRSPVRIARDEDFVHIAPSVVDTKHHYLLAVDGATGAASPEFVVRSARDRTSQTLGKRTPGFQFRQYRVVFVVRI